MKAYEKHVEVVKNLAKSREEEKLRLEKEAQQEMHRKERQTWAKFITSTFDGDSKRFILRSS